MKKNISIHPQYIVDTAGHTVSVILDIKTFKALIEQLEDTLLVTMAERIIEDETEKCEEWETVKKELN